MNIGGTGQTLTVIQALYGNAAAFPGVGGLQVQAAVTEPSRCLETLAATNLTVPKPGCYTFDLGQNMVGWVQLNISGSVGDRITVRHGEMLNPDGTVYTANLRGATATDFYIFGTNGTVTYEPRFTFHGFRYVEVRGLSVPPTLSSVTGIVVHSGHPPDRHLCMFQPAGEPALQQHHLGPERQLSRSADRLSAAGRTHGLDRRHGILRADRRLQF